MKNQKSKLSIEWLVEFKGNKPSLYYDLNFLWKQENVYIMDNHRVAMWCWLQEIKTGEKYNLFHLDRHFDTLYSNIESWLQDLPDLNKVTLDEYLNLNEKDSSVPIIRYDNYLSIFLERYSSLLNDCWFSTYNEGDKPKWSNIQTPPPKSLPSSFEYWLDQSPNRWIINLDIDLFFCDDGNNSQMEMHSDTFIKSVGQILKRQKAKGKIAVITIALSPEWSGGWEKSKRACEILTQAMGVNFELTQVSKQ